MRTLFLATALMATALTAHAEFKFVPPSMEVASIPAGAYAADPSHSSVTFRIAHMGLSNFTGRFNNVDAMLVVDPKAVTSVNMRGEIKLENIDTGNKVLDKELMGSNFFDAAKFPTIRLEARKLEVTGKDSGLLTADVTLRGVTRPVVFQLKFHGHGKNYEGKETLGFSAMGTLKRSSFNMPDAFPGALGDVVEIWLESEFIQKL